MSAAEEELAIWCQRRNSSRKNAFSASAQLTTNLRGERERIFIEYTTSDRTLKASREGSK